MRRLFLAVPLVLGLTPAAICQAQIWDAATDYSSTQNPNGAWTYGWSLNRGAPINLYNNANINFCSSLAGWSRQFPQYPQVAKNETGSTVCCSSTRMPNGQVYLHPGSSGENSVLRWTAPSDGYYFIETGFGGVDHRFPTNSDVAVLHNLQTLSSAELNAFSGPQSCSSSAFGLLHTWSGTLQLFAGDTIDCNVGFGQNQRFNGDSTLVRMRVTRVTERITLGGPCGGQLQYGTGLPFLGQNVSLGVSSAPTSAFGLVNLAAGAPTPTTILGCTIYPSLASQMASITFTTTPLGGWQSSVALPNTTAWHGFQITSQALVLDAAAPNNVQFSGGVLWTL
ncbi:MAG: hypothetical protein NXI31_08585 [bacterium]|nr:hypothetical protein [bacterium]